MKKLLILFCLLTAAAHGQGNLPLAISPTPVRLYPTSPASLSAAYTTTGSSLTLTVVATYGPGERPLPTVDQPAMQVLSDRYIISWTSTQTARQPDQVWLEIRAATTVIRAGYISFERSTIPITAGGIVDITAVASTGPAGATGPRGIQGIQGIQGATGATGAAGTGTGSAGTANIRIDSLKTVVATNVGNIANLASATATLGSVIVTHTTQIAGLSSATATLNSTAITNAANIAGLSSATATIAANVATNTANIAGKEPTLGTPSANGYVLASTTGGVRSWIANGTGSGTGATGATGATGSSGVVAATTPLIYTSAIQSISIVQAAAGINGYLSGADWNTFSGHTAQIAGLASATATLNSTATANAANISSLGATLATKDGSETKITAGANVVISGTGTTANAYVINSIGGGGGSGSGPISTTTSTAITGLLKGAGSLVAAAVAGTDYVAPVAGKALSTQDYTTADQSKLAGIATGATANSPDATLLNRANHTGTQPQTTVNNLVTDLSSITANVAANSGNIATLANTASTNATNIAINTANITGLSSATATLSSNVATNTGSIANHSAQIGGLSSATATLNSNQITNTANIATLTNTAATNAANIAGLASVTATLTNTAATNAANIAGLASSTATLNSTVNTNTGSISNHTAQIAGLSSATATLNSNQITNTANIAVLTSTAATNAANIAGLASATAVLTGTANVNAANIAGLASATATLNSTANTNIANIASLASATATLNNTAATNAANIATHTTQISGLASATATLNNTANTNIANISSLSATLATKDGSETKVTAGANVTVTGGGTTASPYVVNAAAGGGGGGGGATLGTNTFTGTQTAQAFVPTGQNSANNSGLGRYNNDFIIGSFSAAGGIYVQSSVGQNFIYSSIAGTIINDNGNVSLPASVVLDIKSTTKGSRPFPSMTATQRTAISAPAPGSHVYQTDGTEGVYVYKSSGTWVFAY